MEASDVAKLWLVLEHSLSSTGWQGSCSLRRGLVSEALLEGPKPAPVRELWLALRNPLELQSKFRKSVRDLLRAFVCVCV